jgi:hypothetical protein
MTSIVTNSLVNQYWEQLRTKYLKNVGKDGQCESRICYPTDHHGLQSEGYWLLSSHVSACQFHVIKFIIKIHVN